MYYLTRDNKLYEFNPENREVVPVTTDPVRAANADPMGRVVYSSGTKVTTRTLMNKNYYYTTESKLTWL